MIADQEARVSLAWHTEALARERLLKPLRHYLSSGRSTNRESDLLAAMKRAKRGGAKLSIFKLER